MINGEAWNTSDARGRSHLSLPPQSKLNPIMAFMFTPSWAEITLNALNFHTSSFEFNLFWARFSTPLKAFE